nr:pyridoxamine 5'-phosphate oxidase [Actinomycetales bacterium]
MDIRGLRRSYELGDLPEPDVEDPLVLFERWLGEARAVDHPGWEPSAMTLATATPDGLPSARTVLLKEFGADGLVWYTNYNSRKGAELAANPKAALPFYWAPLERQVRVEGSVEVLDPARSDAYFATRPADSRIAAIASPQSRVIPSRTHLEEAFAAATAEHIPPERPGNWGGFLLAPQVWEFWQGRRSRLHDRIRFRRDGDAWVRERLAP